MNKRKSDLRWITRYTDALEREAQQELTGEALEDRMAEIYSINATLTVKVMDGKFHRRDYQ